MVLIVEGVARSLAVKAAVSVSSRAFAGFKEAFVGKTPNRLEGEQIEELQERVGRAFDEMDLSGVGVRSEAIDGITAFLASANFPSFFNSIVVFEFAGGDSAKWDLVLDSLRMYVGEHADLLVEDDAVLVSLCEFLTQLACQLISGTFGDGSEPDGAVVAAAHSEVLGEQVAGIERHLRSIAGWSRSTYSDYQDFVERYRTSGLVHHSEIVPPTLDDRRRVPIDQLYVSPSLVPFEDRPSKRAASGRTEVDDFVRTMRRSVVLGDPGAGKSTLATKVTCELLRQQRPISPDSPVTIIPFVVVLRDYGTYRGEQHGTIVDFIEATLRSKYQTAAPIGAVDWLLGSGRAAVIFDGLDELLDSSFRQDVTASVESFASLYPNAPLLVTTRRVGYREAPLKEGLFDLFSIEPFSLSQVEAYVTNWFGLDIHGEADGLASAFMEESQIVADLRRNPLMLGLMCTIYRGEQYIPRNRPAVYEKCAVMLFERWDKSRGIRVDVPFEAHLRPAMQDLAFWIYGTASRETGVSRGELVEQTTRYLLNWRYEDDDEARRAAGEFIDFCRGRAWVFTDTGATAVGEPIYQFTHGTFLEYFAAAHLVRTSKTTKELLKVLVPRARKAEWDVVSQLAVQIRSTQEQGAAEDILERMLSEAKRKNGTVRSRLNLESFAARSLEFLVPSRSVVRAVAHAVVATWLEISSESDEVQRNPMLIEARDVVDSLVHSGSENSETVGKAVCEFIAAVSPDSDQMDWLMGLVLDLRHRGSEPCPDWLDQAIEENAEDVEKLCRKAVWAGIVGVWNQTLSVEAFVDSHGVGALLDHGPVPGGKSTYISVAEVCLHSMIRRTCERPPTTLGGTAAVLRLLAHAILSDRLEDNNGVGLAPVHSSMFKRNDDGSDRHSEWTDEQLVQAGVLLVWLADQSSEWSRFLRSSVEEEGVGLGHLEFMRGLLEKRYQREGEGSSFDLLGHDGVDFLLDWAGAGLSTD